jgi:ATP-dependent DNA helicase RecQ
LERVKGLSQRLKKRYAKKLIQAIQNGGKVPPPRPRRRNGPRMSDIGVARYEALRAWRKDLAVVRGVEPDVILSNHILMELAQHPPNDAHALAQMDCLDDWQRKTYGAALLQVLNSDKS